MSTVHRHNGLIIIMKGVPGCGKTYLSNMIKSQLDKEPQNVCVIVNAEENSFDIKKELIQVCYDTPEEKKLIIIIDSCGEKYKYTQTTFFGINFADWVYITIYPGFNKKHKLGYLHWSIRNTLRKTNSLKNFYLKTRLLFGKNTLRYVDDIYHLTDKRIIETKIFLSTLNHELLVDDLHKNLTENISTYVTDCL